MPTIVERFRSRFGSLTPGASAPAPKPEWANRCLNCGAALSSAFCPDCGQRVVPPHPTMRELAGDAFAELSGWDGKFIETFRLLLTKPGELTKCFAEGERVRFIAPLRLYLTISLVYFVVGASAPVLTPKEFEISGAGVKIGVTTTQSTTSSSAPHVGAPERAAIAMVQSQQGMMTQADREAAEKDVAKAPRFIRPILKKVIDDPNGFRRSLYETLPRAMFLLLPVFAAILDVFYRKRHYPEHLYFALHLHAFAFLVLMIAELSKFTHVFGLYATLAGIAQVSVPVYGVLALKRVYGGGFGITILKAIGAGLIYMMAYGATIFGVLYYVAVSGS